ncbi:MAG: hypothetical protein RMK29_17050 [Myxococcales bacterium]|nr:hypothetical protein [Myxococcota bacterium]MDW8283417.1 hypothetical protein [Myxococcales bacterium]
MPPTNPEEFVRRYQPETPSLLHCLTVSSTEMEARIAPVWDLPRRATLPRLTDEQRRLMKTSLTEARRARGLEYGALFTRREDLAREANLHGQIFLDLLNKDVVLDQMIEAAGRLARAAQDGRLLLSMALAALSAKVILRIEELVQDPSTPRARRERLLSYLAAIHREEVEQRGRDEAARRRAERRLAGLRQQLEEASRNAAIRRFLEELSTQSHPKDPRG